MSDKGVELIDSTIVARWQTERRDYQPGVRIMEASRTDEGVFYPATDITIYGEDALRALRKVIDAALVKSEPPQ